MRTLVSVEKQERAAHLSHVSVPIFSYLSRKTCLTACLKAFFLQMRGKRMRRNARKWFRAVAEGTVHATVHCRGRQIIRSKTQIRRIKQTFVRLQAESPVNWNWRRDRVLEHRAQWGLGYLQGDRKSKHLQQLQATLSIRIRSTGSELQRVVGSGRADLMTETAKRMCVRVLRGIRSLLRSRSFVFLNT